MPAVGRLWPSDDDDDDDGGGEGQDDDGEGLLGRLWDKYVPVMVETPKRLTLDVWLEEEKMKFCSFVILSLVDVFLS